MRRTFRQQINWKKNMFSCWNLLEAVLQPWWRSKSVSLVLSRRPIAEFDFQLAPSIGAGPIDQLRNEFIDFLKLSQTNHFLVFPSI